MEVGTAYVNALIASLHRQITKLSSQLAQAEAKNTVLETELAQAQQQAGTQPSDEDAKTEANELN